MSDISAVFIGFVRKDEQGNYGFCSTDRFWKPPGLEEARLQINGKPYPNVNVRLAGNVNLPEAEAYHYLMKALRQNCSLETIGNTNAFKEVQHCSSFNSANATLAVGNLKCVSVLSPIGLHYGANKVATPTFVSPDYTARSFRNNAAATGVSILETDSHIWESPSTFILGFDISKSNYNNEFELSGQDLTKSSGLIQINLRFATGTNPSDYQAVVLVRHKRILDIGLDSSQVIY
jgi:hypothetical protein